MPRRVLPDLPLARKRKLVAELAMLADLEAQATLDKHVHVAMAYEAGMTLREIAEVYRISPDTARAWKDTGERERSRRRSGDPVGAE